MKPVKNFACVCMNDNDWKLDNFRTGLDLFVLHTGCLEIQHQEIFYFSLKVVVLHIPY